MKNLFFIIVVLCYLDLYSQYPESTPLNSTPFHKAYTDIKLVNDAAKTKVLNKQMNKFLSHKRRPIDQKLAIINALGEQQGELRNADIFRNHLLRRYKFSTYNPRIFERISADEGVCIAYLMALDNIRNADKDIKFVEWALLQNPDSFSYNLVYSLILAQKAIDEEKCDVYKVKYELENKEGIEKDMRPEAIKIVMDELDTYKKHCVK